MEGTKLPLLTYPSTEEPDTAHPLENASQQALSERCTTIGGQNPEIDMLNSSPEKPRRKSMNKGKNKNNRRRYPPGNGSRIKSATPLHRLMNTKNSESASPVKTLSTQQKRLKTAQHRLESTSRPQALTDYLVAAPRGLRAHKTVITADSDPPAACPSCLVARASMADRPIITQQTTAAARNRHAATSPTDIAVADVSDDKNADIVSVSVDRKMQTTDINSAENFVSLDACNARLLIAEEKLYNNACLQQQYRQINAVNVQTSVQSGNSTEKCKAIDSASIVEIKGFFTRKSRVKN